ncbi:MAG: hypothetical protein ACFWTJ_02480 [Lachnoclostridium sp.]|jgi:hypothetical protein
MKKNRNKLWITTTRQLITKKDVPMTKAKDRRKKVAFRVLTLGVYYSV